MEVPADEFSDLLRMEGYVVAERAVIETSELRNDTCLLYTSPSPRD